MKVNKLLAAVTALSLLTATPLYAADLGPSGGNSGGGGGIAGTVQANQGSAGITPWPVAGAVTNTGNNLGSRTDNLSALGWMYGFNGTGWDPLQVDASKNLKITCVTGCAASGTLNNAFSGVATSSNNSGVLGFLYGWNGASWDQVQVDASKNVKINCVTGCAAGAGTNSNAGDAVAASSTNGASNSWNYAWNGSAWDRMQVDANKNLKTSTILSETNVALSPWSSATAINSSQVLMQGLSAPAVQVTLVTSSGTFTAGQVTFQAQYADGSWQNVIAAQVVDPTSPTLAQIAVPYTLAASTTKHFLIHTSGAQALRVLLFQAITGTGTVTPYATIKSVQTMQSLYLAAQYAALTAPIAAGTNMIGSVGNIVSGNPAAPIGCDQKAVYDASTSGSTQLVAGTSGQNIYLCGYTLANGGTATTVKLVAGTGTNCGTGTANMTPGYQLVANAGIVDNSPINRGLNGGVGNSVCVNTSAANAVQAIIYYTKF